MTDITFPLKPVIAYPREAEPGKTYLMTIDFEAPEGFTEADWPYAEEEYPVFCMVDAGELFFAQALDESEVVVHRFGGTYGTARFLLTAREQEQSGEIRVSLMNRGVVTIQLLELGPVSVASVQAQRMIETKYRVRRQKIINAHAQPSSSKVNMPQRSFLENKEIKNMKRGGAEEAQIPPHQNKKFICLDALKEMTPSQVDEVAFLYDIPRQLISEATTYIQKCISLIQYAFEKEGDNLERLYNVISNVRNGVKLSNKRLRRIESKAPISIVLNCSEDIITLADFPRLEFGFHNQRFAFDSIIHNLEIKRVMYISAPAGYGKSALLKQVAFHFAEHRNYQCFYANVDNLVLEENYRVFDRGRLFIFDTLEKADDITLAWLHKFINILARSAIGKCCVLLAGRYLHTGRSRHRKSIIRLLGLHRQQEQELAGLDKMSIRHFISNTTKADNSHIAHNMLDIWADRIYSLGCGHPSITHDLIMQLKNGAYSNVTWDSEFASTTEQKNYLFDKLVLPKLMEIANIKHKYIHAVACLSIFTCFDAAIVRGLQGMHILPTDIDILLMLTDLSLVCEIDAVGFYTGDLVRKLFLKYIQLLNPNLYHELVDSSKYMLINFAEDLRLKQNHDDMIDLITIIDRKKFYARQYLYLSMQQAHTKYELYEIFKREYETVIKHKFMFPKSKFLFEDRGIQEILTAFGCDVDDFILQDSLDEM